MRALIQRVQRAQVTVDGEVTGAIGPGLCVLLGVTHDDDDRDVERLAEKVWRLRVFPDPEGVMNLSLAETTRAALVISQFTLYGDTSRGRRPSWIAAAPPQVAAPLVDAFAHALAQRGARVERGVFGADMAVELVNDGPVTLLLES